MWITQNLAPGSLGELLVLSNMGFDIGFCTYLDLALPIDPNDRVTPNQASDGKLYWVDYILRQGEHLADRQRSGGADGSGEL